MTEPAAVARGGGQARHTRLGEGERLVADLGAVDLAGPSGVAWALDAPELDVNLVVIRPGEGMDEHRNDEVDVLLIVESGAGELTIAGEVQALAATSIAMVPKGASRSLRSTEGMVYFSIHRRRPGIAIQPPPT